MVTSGQLTLCLGKVERTTVGLGITSYEEGEETYQCWDMTLEDEPAPRTCLCLNDSADLHRASEDNGGDETEA